ncbi:MAG: alpha/beta hydrolase [Verrucomicrobiaceae bacterium]|nr:MAG: alpha/beta hydrolase [Verrucomicrobiaceae bacterium]
MKSFSRLLLRLVFLLIVAVLLGTGGVMAWFSSWRAEKMSHLNAASTIADTKAGKVEYVRSGEGPSLLVFHGSPGGFDQAMLFASSLSDSGFQVIAPSRPGYLRTPLTTGLTPENQADAMLALLDSLSIDSVAVMGVSLGAPAAIEFARRHPERAWALVLVSPVTKKMPTQPLNPPLPEALNEHLTGDMGAWAFVEAVRRDLAGALGGTFDIAQSGDLQARSSWVQSVLGNSAQLAWFQDLAGTFAPLSPRETGLRNDLLQLRVLADVPYDKLTIPALFIHGAEDKWIPLQDVEAAEKRMPNAELLDVPGTGHLVWLGPDSDQVGRKILEFLNRFHGSQGTP